VITESEPPLTRVSRKRWWIHLILIGGYLIPVIPLSMWYAPHRPALSNSTRGLLIVCGIEIALFSIVFTFGWLASRASRDELLLRWRPGWLVVPLGIGYSIGMRLALGVIAFVIIAILVGTGIVSREFIEAFFGSGPPPAERVVDISAMQHNSAYFWLTITLSSFVVAGLREELWRAGTLAGMKALWPDTFADRHGQIAGIALIAIVFGLGHLGFGSFAAAMAGVLGLFLGIIMVMHQSIWPAVIAHGMFDATSFALLPWAAEHLRHLH
jgi:membrane protease YdiL (CAAX protease family)